MLKTILIGKTVEQSKFIFGLFPVSLQSFFLLTTKCFSCISPQPATYHVFISFQNDVQSAIPVPGAPGGLMHLLQVTEIHHNDWNGESNDRPLEISW